MASRTSMPPAGGNGIGRSGEIKALRLTIHGRVQGVGYRAWTERTACRLGLSGWVRNRAAGMVEAVVCGPSDVVNHFVDLAHTGPGAARVTQIDVRDEPPTLSGFNVRETV